MNSDEDARPEAFAARFLELQGAVVEQDAEGWEILLPEALSAHLNTPEYLRVLEDESLSEGGSGYSVSFGSPLLEKLVDMACARMPVAVCELWFDYLKTQGFDRLVREHIRFPAAVGQVESTANARTSYLLIHCRYLAQSDEQKEGLLAVLVNYDSGAFVSNGVIELAGIERQYMDTIPISLDSEKMNNIIAGIKARAHTLLEAEIQPFKESMTRRFKRDVANLEEYYAALTDEMTKGLKRPGLSKDGVNERLEKIALLPDELARKKNDLFKKYSIHIKIFPCAAMLIRMPTVSVLYRVISGKEKIRLSLTYNPLTRTIEPLVCQGCGRSIATVYWCDKSHLLCFECRQNCPVC